MARRRSRVNQESFPRRAWQAVSLCGGPRCDRRIDRAGWAAMQALVFASLQETVRWRDFN